MSEQSDGEKQLFSYTSSLASLEVSGGRGREPQQPQPHRMSSPLIPSPILRGLPMIRPNGYSQWIEGESEREREGPFIHSYGESPSSGACKYDVRTEGGKEDWFKLT